MWRTTLIWVWVKFLSTPSARRATLAARSPSSTPVYFYPRPPRGGRHYHNDSELSILDFYPRPPRGGRQRAPHRGADADPISIHALREEGDRLTASSPTRSVYFYPRPPRGGRPRSSTCRPRAESISIHALREEGDLVPPCVPQIVHGISIHALREEGDYTRSASTAGVRAFLSTPSARRATQAADRFVIALVISIHALREEGDTRTTAHRRTARNFYPRPPRGGRPTIGSTLLSAGKFLSTPSARRATDMDRDGGRHPEISIHALREEGDTLHCLKRRTTMHFYPRPPRGGRLTLSLAWQAA